MSTTFSVRNVICYLFALLLITIGIANLILVHPVPGLAYLLIALLFLPPVQTQIQRKLGIRLPALLLFALGFVLLWFTIGISDLGEIIGF
jgi:hypothetical protein